MTCQHGAERFAGLSVDAYNLELEENGSFVGDRVRSRAFGAILDELRQGVRRASPDPLGDVASEDRASLDGFLERQGSPASRLVEWAIDIYAGAFAEVARRFLAAPAWHGTERVAVGGGLRESRLGEEAIRRADTILRASGLAVEVRPIHADPDQAALIGALRLRPGHLRGPKAILAVDIGGSNVRAGVVVPPGENGSPAEVVLREHWRHRLERVDRDGLVGRLNDMLATLVRRAVQNGLTLAPFVGIGCPGKIRKDGSVGYGTQNLPGDWQEGDFNLPAHVASGLSDLAGEATTVILHNDAVLQGLSETPQMRDVEKWGVLTIGTGLGNARFTNLPE